jgi:hypothetical protein
MSGEKRKLPADFTISGTAGWGNRWGHYGASHVYISGYGSGVSLSPGHVRALLGPLAEWLAAVDPEGGPKPPEPTPPVVRPDLPPIKVRAGFSSGVSLYYPCGIAVKSLCVPSSVSFEEADKLRVKMTRDAQSAVEEFFVKNIVTIEFDVQAGTATVVRPEGGKA